MNPPTEIPQKSDETLPRKIGRRGEKRSNTKRKRNCCRFCHVRSPFRFGPSTPWANSRGKREELSIHNETSLVIFLIESNSTAICRSPLPLNFPRAQRQSTMNKNGDATRQSTRRNPHRLQYVLPANSTLSGI